MSAKKLFEYRIITKADNVDLFEYLTKYFIPEEPLQKACGFTEISTTLKEKWLKTIDHNVSIMAVDDNGKIAGVLMNEIKSADNCVNYSKLNESTDDIRLKAIYGFVSKLYDGVDLFGHCHVDKMFYNYILSVHPMYQGQGLAKELYARSEEVARKMNLQWVKCEVSGLYSQKVFRGFGFEVLKELKYADYVDDSGKPILNIELPHTEMQLLVKKLT